MAVESYYAVQFDETEPTFTLVLGYFPDQKIVANKDRFLYRPYEKINELKFNGKNIEFLGSIRFDSAEEFAIMVDAVIKRNLKTLRRKYPEPKVAVEVA